jgi:glycosyltransferase involved in cell wall biosynthesis
MNAVVETFDVTVIVTTRNEEGNIANCLNSIKRQIYPQEKIEIIVVDNNSSDRTFEIARQFTDKIYTKGPERSAQRNLGVEKAKGKYILYLDADMVLSKNLIEECMHECEENNYIALYIPERVVGDGFWIKVRDFERNFYNAGYIDAVRFVKREKFLESGGFDESLSGPEDWDFDRRIKELGRVKLVNSLLYHNEGKFDFKKYFRKKKYYAKTFDRYIKKWGRSDQIVRKQLGFYYRLFGVFFENGKWRRLIKHPFLAIGMYILRFFVGVIFVFSKCCQSFGKKMVKAS